MICLVCRFLFFQKSPPEGYLHHETCVLSLKSSSTNVEIENVYTSDPETVEIENAYTSGNGLLSKLFKNSSNEISTLLGIGLYQKRMLQDVQTIMDHPVLQSSCFPDPAVFQIQFQLESESGDPYWEYPCSRIQFLGGAGGTLATRRKAPTPLEELPAPKFGYLVSSWRSCAPSWHQDATTSPKIKNNILEPTSSKIAPKTLSS